MAFDKDDLKIYKDWFGGTLVAAGDVRKEAQVWHDKVREERNPVRVDTIAAQQASIEANNMDAAIRNVSDKNSEVLAHQEVEKRRLEAESAKVHPV